MRSLYRAFPLLLVLLPLASLLAPRGARTVPLYAAREGLLCQSCHFDPNGGGPRNEFGFGYAKNRHALTPEESPSPWADLTLTNRIGETMPVYLGVNQRFMLLSNQHTDVDRPERFGFFNMENAIHIAFQPHSKLTLVYTMDANTFAFGNAFRGREAFGMFGGLPANGYVKAGRIRNPFGLRMDDHTVATRNGFGDFSTGGRVLPYDPRQADMGIEVGLEQAGWFGRAAFMNGSSDPFTPSPYAEAKSVKAGYNSTYYQGGISLHDDFVKTGSTPLERQTRWGYYAMTHWGSLALLGEIAAGTDEDKVTQTKTNRLAAFAEVDWEPHRAYNLRLRWDRAELDRDPDPLVRDLNTFSRYALEGEWVPVPFAELRWTLRYLDAKDEIVPDERQAYLQFHFAY